MADVIRELPLPDHDQMDSLIEQLRGIRYGLGIPEVNGVYGFIEHCDTLAPAQRIEYIGVNTGYTPMSVDLTSGGYELNSWAAFPLLEACKPWMVHSSGVPDYMLNENDYSKKAAGGNSDVANADYDGGAYAWICKIYKREVMMGNDRYVMFSFEKRPGFTAVGFIDPDGKELEGVWLPMFYGALVDGKLKSISGLLTDQNHNTATQNNYIKALSDRAHFLGGGFMETLIDLMMMFAKTSDLQSAYGHGNMSGYDSTDTTAHGMLTNAVVSGGMFYGTNDNHSLNKAFHSIVPITQNQWMRDPYELVVNGRLKVGINYNYDLTGATYIDTGIDVFPDGVTPTEGWKYAHIFKAIPGYGSVPVINGGRGSTSLASCDGTYTSSNQLNITAVCLRFANCGPSSNGGPRARYWFNTAGATYWDFGAAPVLLPPVGVTA